MMVAILFALTLAASAQAANVHVERTCKLLFTSEETLPIKVPETTAAKRYARAEMAMGEFQQIIAKIESKTGVAALPASLKSKERYEEKARDEYAGNFNQIHDLVRTTFIVSDLQKMNEVIHAIDESAQITKFRDRISSRDYSTSPDILLVIELPKSNETAEIILRHRLYVPMHGIAHKHYEVVRSSKDIAVQAAASKELAKTLTKVHEALDLEVSLKDLPEGRVVYQEKAGEVDRSKRPEGLPVYHEPAKNAPKVLDAKTIRFMQSTCSNHTGEDAQYSVIGNAKSIQAGTLKVTDLPAIRVWRDTKGRIWTQDHRRLAAFRLAGVKEVPVEWADAATVESRAFKYSTTNEGKTIIVQVNDFMGVEVR